MLVEFVDLAVRVWGTYLPRCFEPSAGSSGPSCAGRPRRGVGKNACPHQKLRRCFMNRVVVVPAAVAESAVGAPPLRSFSASMPRSPTPSAPPRGCVRRRSGACDAGVDGDAVGARRRQRLYEAAIGAAPLPTGTLPTTQALLAMQLRSAEGSAPTQRRRRRGRAHDAGAEGDVRAVTRRGALHEAARRRRSALDAGVESDVTPCPTPPAPPRGGRRPRDDHDADGDDDAHARRRQRFHEAAFVVGTPPTTPKARTTRPRRTRSRSKTMRRSSENRGGPRRSAIDGRTPTAVPWPDGPTAPLFRLARACDAGACVS
jgi:hypothetical protein